jgi:hypothetical protein
MFILRTGRIPKFLALSFLAIAISQAGDVTVTPVVTPEGGGLFDYDYTITNETGNDLPVLDISVTPGLTIQDLQAPAGFLTAYDSGLGLVSFLEDTGAFGPTPLSGFEFDSSVPPGPTTFTATFFDGSTTTGTTQGPVVPEPASFTLFAAGGAVMLFLRRRRQDRSLTVAARQGAPVRSITNLERKSIHA